MSYRILVITQTAKVHLYARKGNVSTYALIDLQNLGNNRIAFEHLGGGSPYKAGEGGDVDIRRFGDISPYGQISGLVPPLHACIGVFKGPERERPALRGFRRMDARSESWPKTPS